jgi:hypothetical protein
VPPRAITASRVPSRGERQRVGLRGAARGELGAQLGRAGGCDHQAVGIADDDRVEAPGVAARGELVVEGGAALRRAAVTAFDHHPRIVPRPRRRPKNLAIVGTSARSVGPRRPSGLTRSGYAIRRMVAGALDR